MVRLFDLVGRVGNALAGATMLLLAALVVLVSAEVCVRTLGWRPLAWATSSAEYLLHYATFLPMPYLVRTKGHVFVEFLRIAMAPRLRRAVELAVYTLCFSMCAYLGWIAAQHGITSWRDGSYETRTFDMPKWLVFLPMVLGFWLAAVEWLRFLVTRDSMYDVDPLTRDGY